MKFQKLTERFDYVNVIFTDNYPKRHLHGYLHAQLLVVGAFSQILSFAQRIGTVDPHY